MAQIGHGQVAPMDAKEAVRIAKDANSDAQTSEDRFEPRGLGPGDRVTVSADDYGRDPIAGEIVFSNAHEIAIRREDPQVGDVVVHFPRAGFVVSKI
jgi:glutathione S-transferase